MFHISFELLGLFSLLIGTLSYVPYLQTIVFGKTRPHAFSWLVWFIITIIVFVAQYTNGAGAGSWATAFTAFFTLTIFFFSLFKGEKEITKSDCMVLFMALSAIPVWYVTKDPLYAVILVSVIDALAFFPTFRKSWYKPHEELPFTFALSAFKHIFSLFALENFNAITSIYSFSLILTNVTFVTMVLLRKRRLLLAK